MVESDQQELEVFTLLRNSAHFNINSLFDEDANRDYQQDSMTLVHGLLGSYPDAFWHVTPQQLPELVEHAIGVGSEEAYSALLDKYGVRRTDKNFWQFSDKLNQNFRQHHPISAGWLDYNRLENR